MKSVGSCIVSWDFSNGKDKAILLVGKKKPGKAVEIVNAFQGEEAEKAYQMLMERKDVRKV